MSSTLALFNNFRKLGFSFFQSSSEVVDVVTLEKNQLDKEVDGFLKNKMLELVLIYVDSGYKLNTEQEKKFYENFENTSSTEIIKIFNRVLEKGVEISDHLLATLFCPLSGKLAEKRWDKDTDPFINFCFKKINDESFANKVYEALIGNLDFLLKQKDSELRHRFHKGASPFASAYIIDPIERFGDLIFKNKKLEDFSLALGKVQSVLTRYEKISNKSGACNWEVNQLTSIMKTISGYSSTHCGNEIAEKQKKIGILYDGGELEKLVAEEYMKLGNQEHVKNLPNKAKEILEHIKQDYLSLNKKLADLTEEDRFNIDNLWSKRIPEIINKYLRADPEFRATMKNSKGESIEDLLVISLNNIHDVLNRIQESHTATVLNDMTVIKQYTRALK